MNNWSHERSDMDGHWVLKDEAEQRITRLERDLAILNAEWKRSTEAWKDEVSIRDKRIAELEGKLPEPLKEVVALTTDVYTPKGALWKDKHNALLARLREAYEEGRELEAVQEIVREQEAIKEARDE